MKFTRVLLTALGALSLLHAQAQETELIAYPTVDEASFVIEVPTDWEMTQAEDEGDFFHLDGPTGAIFSFRTIPGSEEALTEAIEGTMSHIAQLFTDIELGDPQDWEPNGLTGFYATGGGIDEKGNAVRIGVAWCALNDGKIAQVWFVSGDDDSEGMSAAEAIANSIQSPAP